MFEFLMGCWEIANYVLFSVVLLYLMNNVKKAVDRFMRTWRTRNVFGKAQIIIILVLFPATLPIVVAIAIRKLWSLGEKRTK